MKENSNVSKSESKLALFNKRSVKDYLIFTAIILGVVIIDQLTKWLAVKYLAPNGDFPLIKGVLHLTYLENEGAAFGMLKDKPWVFNVVSTIGITVMALYLYLGQAPGKLSEIALAMVIGGGIGNMIDRLTLHYVVDFINFELIDFYIFNGADSFVCVGAALLIFTLLIALIDEYKQEKEEKRKDGSGK